MQALRENNEQWQYTEYAGIGNRQRQLFLLTVDVQGQGDELAQRE